MTEEKPLSDQNEAAASDAGKTSDANDIAAALSALSSAAAPLRADEPIAHADTADGSNAQGPSVESHAPDPSSVSGPVGTAADRNDPTPPPPPPAPGATSGVSDAYPAPTGNPVAVSVDAPPAAVTPPAPTGKRKKWPWILALCIIAGVLLLGGIAACASTLMSTAFHAIQHNERHYDYDDIFNRDTQDGLLKYYYSGMDATFDDLVDIFNVDEGDTATEGAYARGAYRVGGENGIAGGLYYLEGSQEGVSNFYVFHREDDTDDPSYMIDAAVEYFGNYYAQLDEGDAIIFVPFDQSSTMHLASDQPMDTTSPYQSGCYRVGIDIPAGTYTITCQAEAARETDSEAGAYVMKDLDFDKDSITESVFVIKGGRQTITVKDGEYLELFAAIATPATASTNIPLQPAQNGSHHVA